MSLTRSEIPDVLCEFIEIIVHDVLFLRKLYPDTVFVTKRKYGVPVYQSVHPEVNEYIRGCMRAVSFHAKKNQLRRVVVCLQNERKILERYVFDVAQLHGDGNTDTFLLDLERSARSFILRLNGSLAYLAEELPEDSTFSIRLHTTAYSSLEFNQQPCHETFSWIEIKKSEDTIDSAEIVPVFTLDHQLLIVQLYIET